MSAIRPQASKKKKKTIEKAIKIVSPTPEPSSSSTISTSSQSASSVQVSEGESSSSRLDPIDPGTGPSQLESESIALGVVNELEEEEDMNDLRAKFIERH